MTIACHHVMPFHMNDVFTTRDAFFVYKRNAFFVYNRDSNFNTVTITIMDNVSETSIERRRRLKRESNARTKANQTSEQNGPHKGKKENQGLENLHAKQLLHLLLY